jgi:oxygen-independent coproporphyrinogen-3 oxidase
VEENGASLTVTDIAREDAAREHLLMQLRLAEGIDLADYRARWGRAPAASDIARLSEQGFVAANNDILRATPRGRLVLNTLIAELAA